VAGADSESERSGPEDHDEESDGEKFFIKQCCRSRSARIQTFFRTMKTNLT
jgi:hypothetical protein